MVTAPLTVLLLLQGQPTVLGTEQLPGDFGKLNTTYTVGVKEPMNMTLESLDYAPGRVRRASAHSC